MKALRYLVGGAMALAIPAAAADLSPGHWPAAERARLERAEMSPYPPAARTIQGRAEVVSATLSPIAVHAGMEALRQGGTAADAAVTVALTQVATDLGAMVSYAGVAELIYYDARSGRTYAMDAGWGTYAGERDPASIPAEDISPLTGGPAAGPTGAQGRKTLTPGFMAGMAAAHARFGRLPFRDLFAPAIWYAEEGVTVSPLLGAYFGLQQKGLTRTEGGRRFLAQAGTALPKVGARFRQPEVATMLRGVAGQGPSYMYRGPWARSFVEGVRQEGGAVTADDLRRYRVTWETPQTVRFGDATVFGPGRGNPGGGAVLTALNLLDALGTRGAYWEDAAAYADYARAVRMGLMARSLPQLAAFEHARGLPPDRLSPAWAKAVAPELDTLLANGGFGPPGHHSASVVVVDRWGNVAALVHSINAVMWGDTGIVVDGTPLSGAGGLYRARLAQVPAGGHVPGDMAPVIAMRNGRPVLAVATIGSSLAHETVRMTAGPLSGGGLAAWAAAPPMILPFIGPDLRSEAIPAGTFSPQLKGAIEARGIRLREEPAQRVAALRGTAAVAAIDPDGGRRAVEIPGIVVFGDAR